MGWNRAVADGIVVATASKILFGRQLWSRFAESGSNVANCGGRPRLPSFILLGSSRARKQRPGAPPRRWEINDFRIINAPKPFNFPRLNFVQQTSRSPGVETGIARL